MLHIIGSSRFVERPDGSAVKLPEEKRELPSVTGFSVTNLPTYDQVYFGVEIQHNTVPMLSVNLPTILPPCKDLFTYHRICNDGMKDYPEYGQQQIATSLLLPLASMLPDDDLPAYWDDGPEQGAQVVQVSLFITFTFAPHPTSMLALACRTQFTFVCFANTSVMLNLTLSPPPPCTVCYPITGYSCDRFRQNEHCQVEQY